jgi:CheY-like chemotaxis protein
MKTILVARDNALARLRLTSLLRGAGYRVIAVATGPQALTAMLVEAPDLALVGITLPEMDSVDLVQAMREDPRLREVPAIALSLLPLARSREGALAAGFSGHLLEPSPRAKLLAEIQRWIG